MDYRILRPLEVLDGDRQVELGRPKQRAVLAVLLVEANNVVSIDRLIDVLWGDEASDRATRTLHVYISGLRRALEPDQSARRRARVLLTQAPGYTLRVGPDELDATRFESLAARGHQLLARAGPRRPARP